MMVLKLFFAVLFFSITTASKAAIDSSAVTASEGNQVLLNMSKAMKSLNYQGTVVFLKNGKLEAMKYFHAANKDAEQERLLSLNSPLREIIRNSDQVSCHFKEHQQTIVDYRPVERSFLLDIPKNINELAATYSFDIVGEENIAMLPAYVIAIQPKDKFRYVRKIWIEKNYFLPLKVVIYNFSGQALEQVVFTELEVKDSLPFVGVSKAGSTEKPVSIAQSTKPDSHSPFVVSELPQGFQEIFFTRSPVHNSDQLVDHMVLSDGFSSVSVYMENKNTTIQTGLQSIGAVNSFSRTIGDHALTVMGEVPATTVKLIADGLRLRVRGE
ncbi:MAG: outer membrane lipoprotein-sorting protein [Methylococcaceae bacterium]|nr:outer membrane lipoprotein-sorting protein [Methylococcaceae bacterium]